IQAASNEAAELQSLFEGQKFFLSRETPRYALEFMIRSCGGQVSWDPSVGVNPPFAESDETINYQITDRPSVRNRVLSRKYVQPQWVADCINARKILKPSLYEPGAELPAHLSPFVEARAGDYVPKAVMMTNKQRKLYNKMQHGIQQKAEEAAKLKEKKKALKKAKKTSSN
ncbi:mRNA-binding ribosome synthesis protein, partial [Rhizopus azygosporus]